MKQPPAMSKRDGIPSGHLQEEGVDRHVRLVDALPEDDPFIASTLVCFVLVEESTREHTFTSRYDFGPWPLLSNFATTDIGMPVFEEFEETDAVMMNGFVFDELSSDIVSTLARHAFEFGAAIFFDPGLQLIDGCPYESERVRLI